MSKYLLCPSVLLVTIVFYGCTDSAIPNSSGPGVVNVEEDDIEMNAATAKAKETLSLFEENWQTMNSDGYSLKFSLPTSNGELEHIWFSPTQIEGDKFTGECANNPVNIPGLSIGDTRTVSRNQVSDWMIVVGRKCFGGYTIRVLAERDPKNAPPFEFADLPVK